MLVLAIWAALTAYLFLWPPSDQVVPADAVVVFGARSRPERLAAGLRLMRRHIAPVLVLGTAPRSRLCHGGAAFEVVCFIPKPFSTRGEARFVGRLAARRHWNSLDLVTSRWHTTRAGLLLRRCFNGKVHVLGAKPTDDLPQLAEDVAHEWGGVIYALTWARGC